MTLPSMHEAHAELEAASAARAKARTRVEVLLTRKMQERAALESTEAQLAEAVQAHRETDLRYGRACEVLERCEESRCTACDGTGDEDEARVLPGTRTPNGNYEPPEFERRDCRICGGTGIDPAAVEAHAHAGEED